MRDRLGPRLRGVDLRMARISSQIRLMRYGTRCSRVRPTLLSGRGKSEGEHKRSINQSINAPEWQPHLSPTRYTEADRGQGGLMRHAHASLSILI